MISDELQEQASLYALGALSAMESAAFERELAANPELQAFVRDLREVTAALALAAPQATPSPELKDRVMGQIASETNRIVPLDAPPGRRGFSGWIPWAIAAGLVGYCGLLLNERANLNKQLATRAEPAPVVLVALKPAEGAPADAQAVILWDPKEQTGTIKISNLPAAPGKDYQLWAVDAAYADPIDAGIVRVDPSGVAQVQFKPTAPARQVKAFALSIEREGGVPKREGPILLIGTT